MPIVLPWSRQGHSNHHPLSPDVNSQAFTTMWTRIYLVLGAVRLYFALSPSYIHPDENFQGPEVIAGTWPLSLIFKKRMAHYASLRLDAQGHGQAGAVSEQADPAFPKLELPSKQGSMLRAASSSSSHSCRRAKPLHLRY